MRAKSEKTIEQQTIEDLQRLAGKLGKRHNMIENENVLNLYYEIEKKVCDNAARRMVAEGEVEESQQSKFKKHSTEKCGLNK